MNLCTANQEARQIRLVAHVNKQLADQVYRERRRMCERTGMDVSISQAIASLLRRCLEMQ